MSVLLELLNDHSIRVDKWNCEFSLINVPYFCRFLVPSYLYTAACLTGKTGSGYVVLLVESMSCSSVYIYMSVLLR